MSKRKWRRGPKILSLDELARQEVAFWNDKPQHRGWFMSEQFRMAAQAVGKNGVIFYAMPTGVESRFSDEQILLAEKRMGTEPTLEGRTALIQFLKEWDDTGRGDVDDVIDRYEDWEDY